MTEPLSAEWVSALAEASAGRSGTGRSGVVAIAFGKTAAPSRMAVLDIVDGEVRPAGDGAEPWVTIPMSAKQLAAVVAGEESLAHPVLEGPVEPSLCLDVAGGGLKKSSHPWLPPWFLKLEERSSAGDRSRRWMLAGEAMEERWRSRRAAA